MCNVSAYICVCICECVSGWGDMFVHIYTWNARVLDTHCLLCCQKPQGHCGEIGPATVTVMGLGTPQSVSRHRPPCFSGPYLQIRT